MTGLRFAYSFPRVFLFTFVIIYTFTIGVKGQDSPDSTQKPFTEPKTFCCLWLSRIGLPVLTPASPEYNASASHYYRAQNQDIRPACIVQPRHSLDVALALGQLSSADAQDHEECKFAVKGGGHGAHGSSNMQNGVVIDLRKINTVDLSEDEKVARIGGGATWDVVYHALEPKSLAVAGGRVDGVGVGGLTLEGIHTCFSR